MYVHIYIYIYMYACICTYIHVHVYRSQAFPQSPADSKQLPIGKKVGNPFFSTVSETFQAASLPIGCRDSELGQGYDITMWVKYLIAELGYQS